MAIPTWEADRIANVLHSLHYNGYRKTIRMLERKQEKARAATSGYRLSSKTWDEYQATNAMFDLVETDRLLSKAERLSLEIPSDKTDWWYPSADSAALIFGKRAARPLMRA
jgi:hypothetical protein